MILNFPRFRICSSWQMSFKNNWWRFDNFAAKLQKGTGQNKGHVKNACHKFRQNEGGT
jgi:hypothetical protein